MSEAGELILACDRNVYVVIVPEHEGVPIPITLWQDSIVSRDFRTAEDVSIWKHAGLVKRQTHRI